ncbi:LDLR chaperone boca [Condylostylus longicornis]|uniref:LDLR chaperone boca n=1 Tax=Condylostylus longicornis TaxID=2530218 RepID=UPI00244E2B07|nr:LDLR chaperone boca [Condylostylus longicornis]
MYRSILIFLLFSVVLCKKSKEGEKPEWAKKDIRDFDDADMERLFDQWEEDEEPLQSDELPEHLRPPPKIDLSNIDTSNPENLLKISKKGKTLMTFINVSTDKTKEEAEELTKLWQTGLWNNHIQAERYMVDSHRAIFLFKDGAQAWESKTFLLQQEFLESMTIENKVYESEKKHVIDEL